MVTISCIGRFGLLGLLQWFPNRHAKLTRNLLLLFIIYVKYVGYNNLFREGWINVW